MVKNSPDGKLTKAQFAKILLLTEELSEEIFNFIDMADYGHIDEYEFICAMSLFAKRDVHERLASIYLLYDQDMSKILERNEVKRIFKTLMMCSNGKKKEPTDEEVQAKLVQIWSDHQLHDEDHKLHLADFTKVALKDKELRDGLMHIHIVRKGDLHLINDIYDED